MNWLIILYNLLLIVIFIDALAGTFAAVSIFRLRQRFGDYLAKAILANAVESWVAIITAGLAPAPARIIVWLIVPRILVRIYQSWTAGRLALFLLGRINGDHPEVMKEFNDPTTGHSPN